MDPWGCGSGAHRGVEVDPWECGSGAHRGVEVGPIGVWKWGP